MDGKLHNEIISYSKSKEPQESCGFVVLIAGEKVFMPCENVAEDKENSENEKRARRLEILEKWWKKVK